MNKKLVAFDADGTIIDYNAGGIVVDSTRKAITALKENGHVPAIITGRSYNMIDRLADELGIEYIGVLNGAQIFKGAKLLHSDSLGEELSGIILDRIKDLELPVLAFDAKYIYYKNLSERWREFINASINMESNMIPIVEGPYDFASIYSYGDEELLAEKVQGIEGIEFHNGRHEISIEGVNKGNAMKLLADILGISIGDTIAFGDGINDISMLKMAKTGVAIKTGNPAAIAAADLTAGEGPDAIFIYLQKSGLI